jgi:hypothetical protein
MRFPCVPRLCRLLRALALAIAPLAAPALATALLPAQSGDRPPPRQELDTIDDIFKTLHTCWRPPPLDLARPGMEITFRLSFKRDGSILGKPRITYETPGATSEQRQAYREAVAQALVRCAPLPFSRSLGDAIAGRPVTMRLIDTRQQQRI